MPLPRNSSATSPGSESRSRPRLRILIADDDRDAVATLEALLNEEGHQTRVAYHGRDAADAVASFSPDVVLLDIGMPGMTGYDVARQLRERYGATKPVLIAITGWNRTPDKLMAKTAGIDHHIAKPYDPNALLALIAEAGRERVRP